MATDILGVSGRVILAAVVAGQAGPEALADLARGRLRGKIPQLRQALRGRVTRHRVHRLEQLGHKVTLGARPTEEPQSQPG